MPCRTAIALASDCLLQFSELVPAVAGEPDVSGPLTVRHSKADQKDAGATLYGG